MMFQGTYTSDFYRAIRNLLHEQISLQTLEVNPHDAEHYRANRALDRRWHELLAQEPQYRSLGGKAAAAL